MARLSHRPSSKLSGRGQPLQDHMDIWGTDIFFARKMGAAIKRRESQSYADTSQVSPAEHLWWALLLQKCSVMAQRGPLVARLPGFAS